jgi:hypothetical protein
MENVVFERSLPLERWMELLDDVLANGLLVAAS